MKASGIPVVSNHHKTKPSALSLKSIHLPLFVNMLANLHFGMNLEREGSIVSLKCIIYYALWWCTPPCDHPVGGH